MPKGQPNQSSANPSPSNDDNTGQRDHSGQEEKQPESLLMRAATLFSGRRKGSNPPLIPADQQTFTTTYGTFNKK